MPDRTTKIVANVKPKPRHLLNLLFADLRAEILASLTLEFVQLAPFPERVPEKV
jgi:hypothetical protein